MDKDILNSYNPDFDWRWRMESIQPGGPTGANIGTMLQDLRAVWNGQQAQAMNNELAQNAAYRKELENEGKELTDVWNSIDNRNLELARFADAQQGRANAAQGHRNSWMQNYSDAVAKGDNARIKLLEQQATELFGDNALQIINQGKIVADNAKEQNYNYDKIMESLPSTDRKFDNPEQRNAAIAVVNQAEKDGEITREQATKARTKINSIPDWTTINLNMSKQAHSQNRVNKSVENKNIQDKDKWIEDYKAKYPGHTDAYYEERYKKAHKL